MLLNNDQQAAYQKIKLFLNSKNKVFTLTGAAGTGKTTVISQIFKSEEYSNKKIVLAATTNKAVSVIEQMFNLYHENIDFHTIHKICNIKRSIDHEGNENYNFDEKPSYSKNKKSIYNYDIIVIDEASMICLNMLKYIKSIKYKIRGKIIFVGDAYQLPPVNENISNAFQFEYFDDSFFLNKIMRFKNNILDFSIRIRESIDSKKPISIKNIGDSTFEIVRDHIKWKKIYLNEFSYDNTFLAYTNKKCNEINNYIRKSYFNKKDLEEYIVDELIVFNNYYNSIVLPNNDDESTKFYTSNSGKILNCKKTIYTIPNFPIDSLFNIKKEIQHEYKLKKVTKKDRNDCCPICYEPMNLNDTILETDCKHIFCESCIKVWLEQNKTCPFCRMKIIEDKIIINNDNVLTLKINNLFDLINNNKIKIWDIDIQTNKGCGKLYVVQNIFKNEFKILKEKIKSSIIDLKNYIYKNLNKQDNRFILKKIWEYYYVNYIDIFADINYGYCITVHKSQGSTYKNVFIDAKNILEYNRKDFINYKCLYTAITRASNKIYMLV